MTRVQATFVQGTMTINNIETPVYAVQLADGTYVHEQPQSEISLPKYQKLIQRNFPTYDFTTVPEIEVDDTFDPNKVDISTGEVLETPKEEVPIAPKATAPAPPPVKNESTKTNINTNTKTSTMKTKKVTPKKAPKRAPKKTEDIVNIGIFSIDFNKGICTDIMRNEVAELPSVNNTNDRRKIIKFYSDRMESENKFKQQLKQEPMEQQVKQEPVTEPIQAEVIKPSGTRRMRRGLAKGTELGIQTVTTTAITALCLASDILATMADGVAWTEAAMIKPLGLHPDETRRQLKEKAIQRTDNLLMKVYAVPMVATASAKALVNNARSKQTTVQPQPQTV